MRSSALSSARIVVRTLVAVLKLVLPSAIRAQVVLLPVLSYIVLDLSIRSELSTVSGTSSARRRNRSVISGTTGRCIAGGTTPSGLVPITGTVVGRGVGSRLGLVCRRSRRGLVCVLGGGVTTSSATGVSCGITGKALSLPFLLLFSLVISVVDFHNHPAIMRKIDGVRHSDHLFLDSRKEA